MGIKSWVTKKVVQSQMKDVPAEYQELFMELFEKNPELLTKIGTELKARIDKGEHQMAAGMAVMKKYAKDLGPIMQTLQAKGLVK